MPEQLLEEKPLIADGAAPEQADLTDSAELTELSSPADSPADSADTAEMPEKLPKPADSEASADKPEKQKTASATEVFASAGEFCKKSAAAFTGGTAKCAKSTAKALARGTKDSAKLAAKCAKTSAAAVYGCSQKAGKASAGAIKLVAKGTASSVKASAKSVHTQLPQIFAGLLSVLIYIGSAAWTVLSSLCTAVFGAVFAFVKTFFGTIFGWFAKKLKQPLYDVWCFILTPIAHAWGHFAHAHIRLKKASKRGFIHAVGSWLCSFWKFLGGVFEVLRFGFNYIAPVVSIIFLISLIKYASTLQYAITLEYNGSELGTIGNEAAFNEAQAMVQDKVTFTDDTQSLVAVPKFSVQVLNMDKSENQPVDDIDKLSELMIETGEVPVVYAYELDINGDLVGVYTEEDMVKIRDALETRLNTYNGSNDIDVRFEDDIVIKEGRFIENALTETDEALELINGSTAVEAYYVAKRGDTISGICESLGISREDFDRDNPDFGSKVHKGDIVTYHYSEPHLNVITTHYENYDRVIERTVEYVESSKYEQYCEILLQHGSDGYENVTALVTEVNGKESERTIVSRTVLEEMVPRKFRVGTKPNTYLSEDDYDCINTIGTMVWPLARDSKCYISSLFGYRRWDHSNHGAVDIAGIPRGTDIYAAADGKVTFSGSYAAYGKLVIIDHGNGYESYYGHCSELDVEVGDRVEKGDVIAHVGMTGNTSGYHLHFELRHNDKRFDPLIALGGTGGHRINE